MIIFIFGDSITQGYWDKDGGWADKIRSYVFKQDIDQGFKYYHGVHNLGIDGNTTQQVINRFNNEVDARLWPDSEYGFIFAIGVNDTIHLANRSPENTPDQYREQIIELQTLASKYSSNIAFVNLLPVNENLTNPLPTSDTSKCFTNDQIELFNTQLENVHQDIKTAVIDVRSKYLENNYQSLLEDGLHPNTNGHNLIYEAVLPTINSWLYTPPQDHT